MAALGWDIVGIEPGAELADIARMRLASHGAAHILTSTFEEADIEERAFDVVASATAWHWVQPSVGYAKAARVLGEHGVLALWWNAHVPDTDAPSWLSVRRVYERVAPELAWLARLTPDRPDYDPAAEVEASGFFTDVQECSFPFSVTYVSDQFSALIDTYASHQRLDQLRRERLHRELRATIDGALGGTVTKPYEAVLVLARAR